VHAITYTHLASPVGDLLVTDHGDGLSGVYFPDHRRGPAVVDGWTHDEAPFVELADQLDAYFRGERTAFDLTLRPRGTPFQHEVWEVLRTIPYGASLTYGEVAERVERPGSARAVASAVARNPLSIVVPCHRVVGSGRALTGYAGGVERKRRLLELEGWLRSA
jgi:methylated-DNA-[protein]-cysteine S-methyltransferase